MKQADSAEAKGAGSARLPHHMSERRCKWAQLSGGWKIKYQDWESYKR